MTVQHERLTARRREKSVQPAMRRLHHTHRLPSRLQRYALFGQTVVQTGPAASSNPFRFSTKYHDPYCGLLSYGFRYYGPGMGRWMSPDPIVLEDGVNAILFVGNTPVMKTDVLGLYAWTVIWQHPIHSANPQLLDPGFIALLRYTYDMAPRGSYQIWNLTEHHEKWVEYDWTRNKCVRGSNERFSRDVTEVATPKDDTQRYETDHPFACYLEVYRVTRHGFSPFGEHEPYPFRSNFTIDPAVFNTMMSQMRPIPSITVTIWYEYIQPDLCPCCADIQGLGAKEELTLDNGLGSFP